MTKSDYFETKKIRNKVQAIHNTGEMTGPVQRTVKNVIDDLKLVEVDNSPHVHESTLRVS